MSRFCDRSGKCMGYLNGINRLDARKTTENELRWIHTENGLRRAK
jgi:hypothetical protein